MMIDLRCVQSRKNHFRYRRKVPAALQEAFGKREIVIPLGRRKPNSSDDGRKQIRQQSES